MMITFTIGAIIFLFVSFIFMCLLYPLWTIVDCANSPLNSKAKTIWIVVMIIVWPLGSFVYGLFASDKKIMRSLVILFLIIVIGSVGLVISSLGGVMQQVSETYEISSTGLNGVDMQNLSSQEISELLADSNVLKSEIEDKALGLNKRFRSMCVGLILEPMLEDKYLSREEYQEWDELFKNRHTIDFSVLQNYMRTKKIPSGTQAQI